MTTKKDILATLSYFDIFHYPLTENEIFKFSGNVHPYNLFEEALRELCAEHWVYHFNGFYYLHNQPSIIERRKQGNLHAEELLKIAGRVAAFLSCFPFVRGIGVSGSLSKRFACKNSDIDFFIITEKNKLWLARTFMHLFKKITLVLRIEKWFCMNYYIDEEMLQIKEKNIFTAIELSTLIPFRGRKTFQEFFAENRWASDDYLPNYRNLKPPEKNAKNFFLKRLIEALFRNSLGDRLDRYLMNLTTKRWAEKTAKNKLNDRGIPLSLDSSRHYAKQNPKYFQMKVVQEYEKKVSELFQKYDQSISRVLTEKVG